MPNEKDYHQQDFSAVNEILVRNERTPIAKVISKTKINRHRILSLILHSEFKNIFDLDSNGVKILT